MKNWSSYVNCTVTGLLPLPSKLKVTPLTLSVKVIMLPLVLKVKGGLVGGLRLSVTVAAPTV